MHRHPATVRVWHRLVALSAWDVPPLRSWRTRRASTEGIPSSHAARRIDGPGLAGRRPPAGDRVGIHAESGHGLDQRDPLRQHRQRCRRGHRDRRSSRHRPERLVDRPLQRRQRSAVRRRCVQRSHPGPAGRDRDIGHHLPAQRHPERGARRHRAGQRDDAGAVPELRGFLHGDQRTGQRDRQHGHRRHRERHRAGRAAPAVAPADRDRVDLPVVHVGRRRDEHVRRPEHRPDLRGWWRCGTVRRLQLACRRRDRRRGRRGRLGHLQRVRLDRYRCARPVLRRPGPGVSVRWSGNDLRAGVHAATPGRRRLHHRDPGGRGPRHRRRRSAGWTGRERVDRLPGRGGRPVCRDRHGHPGHPGQRTGCRDHRPGHDRGRRRRRLRGPVPDAARLLPPGSRR